MSRRPQVVPNFAATRPSGCMSRRRVHGRPTSPAATPSTVAGWTPASPPTRFSLSGACCCLPCRAGDGGAALGKTGGLCSQRLSPLKAAHAPQRTNRPESGLAWVPHAAASMTDPSGLPRAGCLQSQAPLLDDQAAIFYVEQPGFLSDGTGLLRGDAQLQPQGRGARCHSLAADIRRLFRRPEYIDQADLPGDIREPPVDALAEDGISVQVDRDDAPALLLHVRGHKVRRLRPGDTRAYDGDCVVGRKDALNDGIGISHLAHRTAPCRAAASAPAAMTREPS